MAEVGKFENITPPGVKEVLSIVLDPVNAGTLYAGTANTGIYKSENCGATWAKTNTGTNADLIDSGGQWSLAIDPVFPSVLYAGSLYGKDLGLLKSIDAGKNWISLFPPGSEISQVVNGPFLQEVTIDPDPARHQHLLVTFHDNCKGAYAPMCMAESFNGGDTWRLFKGPASGWQEDARPFILSEKEFLYVTYADGSFYSPDSGATWEKVGVGGNHQMYRSANGTWYLGTAFFMTKSTDGRVWTKIEGAPGGDGVVGDGDRLFTGYRYPPPSNQPYNFASEKDDSKWTALESPSMTAGSVSLRYDAAHRVLFSANTTQGLWRMVTKPKQ